MISRGNGKGKRVVVVLVLVAGKVNERERTGGGNELDSKEQKSSGEEEKVEANCVSA